MFQRIPAAAVRLFFLGSLLLACSCNKPAPTPPAASPVPPARRKNRPPADGISRFGPAGEHCGPAAARMAGGPAPAFGGAPRGTPKGVAGLARSASKGRSDPC